MTAVDLWLWLVYGFAALSLVILAWYLMRGVKSQRVKDLVVLFLIALLFTPVTAVPAGMAFAPAVIVWVIEVLATSEPAGWRGAGVIIGVYVGLVTVLFLRDWAVERFVRLRSPSSRPASPTSE